MTVNNSLNENIAYFPKKKHKSIVSKWKYCRSIVYWSTYINLRNFQNVLVIISLKIQM